MKVLIWKTENVPVVVDDDQIETLIKNNAGQSKRDIAEILHISHMNALRHLKQLNP